MALPPPEVTASLQKEEDMSETTTTTHEVGGLLRADVPIETRPIHPPSDHETCVVAPLSFKTADELAEWISHDMQRWLYCACSLFGEENARAVLGARILIDLTECCVAISNCLRTGILQEMQDGCELYVPYVLDGAIEVVQDNSNDLENMDLLLSTIKRAREVDEEEQAQA